MTVRHSSLPGFLVIAATMLSVVSNPCLSGSPDMATATIAELQDAMADGRLTSERLTKAYLDRIAAYDKTGPAINAVITLNPAAVDEARTLDAERRERGGRGPLHGIPVILKDNIDTRDLPTTGGCHILEDSVPPDDAFLVRRLRDAGAIIIAKVNLSELASANGAPDGYSSMGGQTRNPHDLTRDPDGSSGGTGAAIAAAFAQFGLGTDTSSSVRAPCSATGIAGLRPTTGLLSRDGIIPLSLSWDTAGPMARSVYDVAVALGVLAGHDPADPVTAASDGRVETDYVKYLRRGSLKGARIGLAREFMGADAGTDRVMELAVLGIEELGAEIVPVRIPEFVKGSHREVYSTIRNFEFPVQISGYLATLGPEYPHSLAELVARAEDPANGYRNPPKLRKLRDSVKKPDASAEKLYRVAQEEGRALVRAGMQALFAGQRLDAIVYPTVPTPAGPIDEGPRTGPRVESALHIAAVAGFPDLVVPAGMTADGLPVTISFLGLPFTEEKLLGYGYDFEQATHARQLPVHTPLLPGDIELAKMLTVKE